MRRTTIEGSRPHASEKFTGKKRRVLIKPRPRPVTVAGLRNRALLGLIAYGVASLDTVIRMRITDYYRVGQRGWVRVTTEAKERSLMMPRELASDIERYLAAAGLENEPESLLFRAVL